MIGRQLAEIGSRSRRHRTPRSPADSLKRVTLNHMPLRRFTLCPGEITSRRFHSQIMA